MSGTGAYIVPIRVLYLLRDFHRITPGGALLRAPHDEDLLVVFTKAQQNRARAAVYYRGGVIDAIGSFAANNLHRLPAFTVIETAPHHDIDIIPIGAVVFSGFTEG